MLHTSKFKNPVVKWIDSRLPIVTLMHHEYVEYPVPKNVNYLWAFGAIAMIMLITMILTGILLAMQYVPNTQLAFDSVERIMRDVNYGWLLRYMHANGASFFFIAVYIHFFRGLYYGSYKYPREIVWLLGIFIILAMMATAFMGYVLPWGQMSLWGATVITNLFSAFPIVGDPIVTWLWGGFSVDNPTLNRFFALHYLLPFVLFGLVLLHTAAFHVVGSNNPLGIEVKGPQDSVPFHPYATVKDLFAVTVFLAIYATFVFFDPNYLGHPDNYIPANPMVTPPHIVPEWYFLPLYAILRAIPDKLGGVCAMFGAVVVLLFLPWIDTSKVRSAVFRPIYRQFFWILVADVILLVFCGANLPDGSWVILGQIGTAYYFFHFLILLPLLGKIEPVPTLPNSISEAVLSKKNKKGSNHAGAAA
ncbi:Cytochrome b [Azospirillaceae bacterium]